MLSRCLILLLTVIVHDNLHLSMETARVSDSCVDVFSDVEVVMLCFWHTQ